MSGPFKLRTTRNGVFNVRMDEVEPGRGIPNDWDAALFETWAERKARRAAERAASRNNSGQLQRAGFGR